MFHTYVQILMEVTDHTLNKCFSRYLRNLKCRNVQYVWTKGVQKLSNYSAMLTEDITLSYSDNQVSFKSRSQRHTFTVCANAIKYTKIILWGTSTI